MTSQAFDYKYLLLENYKSLNISENELATILMMEHLINQGNKFITADLLALKMSLNVKEIDQVMANLFTRGFIEFTKKGNHTITSLEPLYTKLRKEFEVSLTNEEECRTNKELQENISNVISCFENMVGHVLSPVESSKIEGWVVNHVFDPAKIIDAIKECASKNKKTLRSVEKVLITWQSRDDIEAEGQTTLSEDWNKNLEETIRIAKTPWLDKKDD